MNVNMSQRGNFAPATTHSSIERERAGHHGGSDDGGEYFESSAAKRMRYGGSSGLGAGRCFQQVAMVPGSESAVALASNLLSSSRDSEDVQRPTQGGAFATVTEISSGEDEMEEGREREGEGGREGEEDEEEEEEEESSHLHRHHVATTVPQTQFEIEINGQAVDGLSGDVNGNVHDQLHLTGPAFTVIQEDEQVHVSATH